jgi:predicted metal-binding membrane protein
VKHFAKKKEEKEEKTIQNSHGLWNKDCCLFLLLLLFVVVVAVAVVNEIQEMLFSGSS